jgi:hypothetical protein
MCSNFGLNHNPEGPPCALETRWYSLALRLYYWLQWKLRRRPSWWRQSGISN